MTQIKAEAETWQEKLRDDFHFPFVLNTLTIETIINWIEQNKELIGQRVSAGVWLKASERLPEVTEMLQQLVVRYNNDRLVIAGLSNEAKIGEPELKTLWINGEAFSKEDLDKIEWLDETQEHPAPSIGYTESQIRKIWDASYDSVDDFIIKLQSLNTVNK